MFKKTCYFQLDVQGKINLQDESFIALSKVKIDDSAFQNFQNIQYLKLYVSITLPKNDNYRFPVIFNSPMLRLFYNL